MDPDASLFDLAAFRDEFCIGGMIAGDSTQMNMLSAATWWFVWLYNSNTLDLQNIMKQNNDQADLISVLQTKKSRLFKIRRANIPVMGQVQDQVTAQEETIAKTMIRETQQVTMTKQLIQPY